MGVVYRAHDERLERDVAIKILPAGLLADESARKRFKKEALALAKLNHPNIGTLHDFDSADGTDFLVMEYIPGTMLSDKIGAGPLPEQEVLDLGVQLVQGLAAAHEQHIVHRDLKPGNVRVLPDGRLKILDFGLAKLVRPVDGEALTASLAEGNEVAGTLPYMAPEQLRGEPADTRSDIWALGVVLYEMAAGARPFQGNTGFALSSAIMNEAPPPLPAGVRGELRALIERCLEKQPASATNGWPTCALRWTRSGRAREHRRGRGASSWHGSPRVCSCSAPSCCSRFWAGRVPGACGNGSGRRRILRGRPRSPSCLCRC